MRVGVDMDHTLTLAFARDHMLEEAHATGQWDSYHSASVNDKPAKVIIDLAIALHNAGHEIFIVTSRPRKWLKHTFAWLHNNGIKVEADHILMRPDDAYRSAPEIKMELVDGLNIDLFIDDREDVSLWMGKIGITTLQVRLAT